jgi:hypothetical protein
MAPSMATQLRVPPPASGLPANHSPTIAFPPVSLALSVQVGAAVQLDKIDWARLGRSGRGRDPSFLFRRYAMELMSCSDVYGFGRKR